MGYEKIEHRFVINIFNVQAFKKNIYHIILQTSILKATKLK